jgi:hypothetical protein
MHALFSRLRVGGAPQALASDPEIAADLLHQADEALEAAHIRIAQLTEALQGLVELGDATRPRNMAEVRRRLIYAQRLLSAPTEDAPDACASAPARAAIPASAPPLFLSRNEPERPDEQDDLERDLDNLKKILKASWSS